MSRINRGLFTSASEHWATPMVLYQALDTEFGFDDDPCPLHSIEDGLHRDWGQRIYCNPPYGRSIGKWIAKGICEAEKGKLVVMLVPSRTDTRWWHDLIMKHASQIRFLRGRLRFNEHKQGAPFPSAVVIFREAGFTV